ncbi:MAG: DNA-directed RNA polymerase subunit omega [Candidatus Krumholzibacteriia bacterium]|jgi:DNA-directed RNA polymerase subunit K/omega
MIIAALERITEVIPNRYEAVRIMAKEARRINTLIRLSGEEIEEKPTSIAMKRLIDGKVKYMYAEPEGEK